MTQLITCLYFYLFLLMYLSSFYFLAMNVLQTFVLFVYYISKIS